jgi:hypothetical protein
MFSVRTHGADGANARRATTTIGLFTNPTAKVDAVVKSAATFFWRTWISEGLARFIMQMHLQMMQMHMQLQMQMQMQMLPEAHTRTV